MNTTRYPDAEPRGAPEREPEKLRLPAGAVRYLLELALRTQLGEAWWLGFTTAHGEPSWVTERRWAFKTQDAEVVRAVPQAE